MPRSDITEEQALGAPQQPMQDTEYRALIASQRLMMTEVGEIARRQRALEKRYDARIKEINLELKINTQATNAVKTDTADLVAAIKAIQGGMAVLGWIGKLIKPLLWISIPGGFAIAIWHGLEDWGRDAARAIINHK